MHKIQNNSLSCVLESFRRRDMSTGATELLYRFNQATVPPYGSSSSGGRIWASSNSDGSRIGWAGSENGNV